MNPILVIKKNKKIKRLYIAAWDMYYSALTIISPTLNTKARYKQATGKKLNLSNPKAFNEKLLWLKLNDYIKNPLVIQCADKYRVRSYIKKCGYSDLLTKTYGVYKNADEIPWEDLPDKFVLKWNFGAGMNVLCSDKNKFDIESAVQKLDKWGRTKYWLPYSEMQYKYAPKKIICEEFLENEDEPGVIPDYKVYCFHGKPLAIFVMHDRGKK